MNGKGEFNSKCNKIYLVAVMLEMRSFPSESIDREIQGDRRRALLPAMRYGEKPIDAGSEKTKQSEVGHRVAGRVQDMSAGALLIYCCGKNEENEHRNALFFELGRFHFFK